MQSSDRVIVSITLGGVEHHAEILLVMDKSDVHQKGVLDFIHGAVLMAEMEVLRQHRDETSAPAVVTRFLGSL